MFGFFERLVSPYPDGPVEALPHAFFPFLWACARGMRRYVAAMTVMTASIGVFEALLFSMLGYVVDWLAKVPPAQLWSRERAHLMLLTAILLGSVGMIALQSLLKQQALAGNFAMRLRWNFHRNMLAQSLSFYQDEFAGRVAAKVMQTALAARDTWMILADILVFVLIYFVTIALVVGGFSLWLLAPFFGWLGCYLLAVWYFVPRLGAVAKAQADARSLMTGRITDAYTNIATVKLFSHTRRESVYVQGAMAEFLQTVYRQMRMVTGFEIVNHLLSMGLIAGTGGATLWLWTRGQVGVGAVAAATAMALRLNGISHWVMWEMASLFEQIGTVQDGINTLARRPTVIDRPDAVPLKVSRGDVRFEHVSFNYGAIHHDSSRVIENLNIHIRAGEKIGLVGRSGAGKSTIVNLLLRFYDISHGRVLIDGQDIAHATQDSLRAQIGMVTQDTSLLHRSVRENILYGRPDAGEAEMIAAAKRAEAHDFVATLSDPNGRTGYSVHVGERGVKLSGGQRQRIAIARVMLKDAPILLLDEATSALDSEVEAAIQQSLYRLMEGKTVMAIAHRLSTIAAMDRLIVLDRGRIVEEGNHYSLLAQKGLYARLWAHQSGGVFGRERRVRRYQRGKQCVVNRDSLLALLPTRWLSRFSLAPTDLLRDRTYRRLWTSILISSFGGQVTLLAIPLTAAVLMHAAPTQMGLLTAMEIIPFALFSLPTGVILDRVRKLPVYIFGELSIACAVATVPVAWWLGWLSMTWLYVVAFIIGAVNTTAGSAAQIVLTQIVPRTRLVEAHAKNALASATAEVTGPAAAGALIKITGAPLALLADACLLMTSAAILRGVPVKETPSKVNPPFWPAMREGLNFVRGHKLLVTMAACVGTWQLCSQSATVVQILFAIHELGLSERGVGFSYVALGVGTITASANGHRVVKKLGPGPTMVLGLAISGSGWLLLAVAPANSLGVFAYATMLLLYGVGAIFIFINFLSLRQSVTPAHMLGRMTSTMRWLILLPAGPGALIGGWLGEHIGLRTALGFSGVTALLLACVAWRLPVIRSVKTLPTLKAEAVTPFSSDSQ